MTLAQIAATRKTIIHTGATIHAAVSPQGHLLIIRRKAISGSNDKPVPLPHYHHIDRCRSHTYLHHNNHWWYATRGSGITLPPPLLLTTRGSHLL